MSANIDQVKNSEITPQMINAGLQAFAEFQGEGDVRLVTEILRAGLRLLPAKSEQRET